MQKFDIIVIGSGLGGLECGTLLSKAGYKVCVMERSNQPGGCMQSYTRKGLHFDTGLHYVGGLSEGQPLYNAFRELGLMDLPWHRMDEDFDHVIIGNQEYCLSQGYDTFIETLTRYFPSRRNEIQQYADKLRHDSHDDMDINAWQWLKDTLKDDRLVDVVSAPSMKIELRKGSLPLFSFLHSNKSYIESSWRLCGDGNIIVHKLISQIKEHGGTVICHSEVVSLSTTDDVVTSVTCRNGEEYAADKFISDIHPGKLSTLFNIQERRNRTFSRRMQGCTNTFGIFTASLVLKPETLKYVNHNIYIYKERVWNPVGNGDTDCVMVSCRCPEEGLYARQVDLLTPMKWDDCLPWADTTVGHRGESYKEMCNKKATECISLAERAIPHLSDMVESIYTSSPLTYHDYLAAPDGTAFGMRKDYEQSMMTFLSVKTPYRNLFLTGQNIVLSGIEGVTMTALDTVKNII